MTDVTIPSNLASRTANLLQALMELANDDKLVQTLQPMVDALREASLLSGADAVLIPAHVGEWRGELLRFVHAADAKRHT